MVIEISKLTPNKCAHTCAVTILEKNQVDKNVESLFQLIEQNPAEFCKVYKAKQRETIFRKLIIEGVDCQNALLSISRHLSVPLEELRKEKFELEKKIKSVMDKAQEIEIEANLYDRLALTVKNY